MSWFQREALSSIWYQPGRYTDPTLLTPWGPALPSWHTAGKSAGGSQPGPKMQSSLKKKQKTFEEFWASSGGARDTQGEAELYSFRVRLVLSASKAPWLLCWAFPPDSQIFISVSLMNSTGSVLMTLHCKGPRAGGSWPWCTLRILLSVLRLSTGFQLKPGEHHSHLPDDSLKICHTQLGYHLRPFQRISLMSSQRAKAEYRVFCAFSWPSPGPILVAAGHGPQLGPIHELPGPAKEANREPKASCRQNMIFT